MCARVEPRDLDVAHLHPEHVLDELLVVEDESQQLLTRVHPRAPASRDDAPLRRLRGSFGAGLTGGIARSG